MAGVALLISAAAAQNGGAQAQGSAAAGAAANSGAASAGLESGTAVEASLTKAVDAKKAKPGDAVEARVTQDVKSAGHVVVPKGSKLVGHVTQAQAREKGSAESSLGLAFDHAVLKNGQTLAFQGVIRGLAAAPHASGYDNDEGMASASGPGYEGAPAGGGPIGGAARGIGNTAGGIARDAGAVGSTAAGAAANTVGGAAAGVGATGSGALGASTSGIRGLPGIQIDSSASTSANGTVLVSNSRNVHLDSGTQLMIQVTTQ